MLTRRVVMATLAGCASVEAVGHASKAGTNCGSCRSEIGRLIRERGREDGPGQGVKIGM